MGSKLIHFSVQPIPAMRVIGKTIRVKEPTTLDDPTIPDLWESMARDGSLAFLQALPGRITSSPDAVGWMGDFQPGDNAYTYLAGVFFQPGAAAPEGFVFRDVAAAEMAVGWIQATADDEGGDMMASASGHLSQARDEHGYTYDDSNGFFEMEVYSEERFYGPLRRGELPAIDFYSPCAKAG